jgi:hypothetical protein
MSLRSPETSSVQGAVADQLDRFDIAASWISDGSTPHESR